MKAPSSARTDYGTSPHKVNDLEAIPLGQGSGRPMLLFEDTEIVFDSQAVRNQTQLPDELLHRSPGLQFPGLPIQINFDQSHRFPSPDSVLDRPFRGSGSASKYRIEGALWKGIVWNAPVSAPVSRLVEWEDGGAK